MKKVYISGKMTGLKPRQIKKIFGKTEKRIIENNPDMYVMNPAVTYNMLKYDAFSYEDWLRIDFAMIDACDAIVMIPNWKDSIGAKREIAYAYKHNKKVYYPNFKLGETVGSWIENEELTREVTLEVEKHDVKKQLDELFDTFVEKAAIENIIGDLKNG